MASWNNDRNRYEEKLFDLYGDQSGSSYGLYHIYLTWKSVSRSGTTVTLNTATVYGVRDNSGYVYNRGALRAGIGGSENNVVNNGTLYPRGSASPATFDYSLGSPSTTTTGTSFSFYVQCANTGYNDGWTNFQSGSPVQKTVTISCPAATSAVGTVTAGSTLSGPTINVTKYDSSFTDNITLTYNNKTITRNGFTSSTLSFTEAERLAIFQAQDAGTTKTWSINGTTMSGSTQIGTFSGTVNITTESLASVSSANNFNVGDSTSYKCSKGGAGSFSVYARVTGPSGSVAGSSTNQTTDGTKTMSFTDSIIYGSNTSSPSGTIYWTVTSYINGTSVGTTSGKTCTYTFLKSRCGPSLTTFKYAVTDAGTKTLMNLGSTTTYYDYNSGTNLNKFIQTKTTLGFQLNGSTASGSSATISKFYVKVPGQSDITASASGSVYTCGSGVLATSGTIYGYIKDSRGFEDFKSFTFTLNEYYQPTFSYTFVRNPMQANTDVDKYAKLAATISMPSYIASYLISNGAASSIQLAYKLTTAATSAYQYIDIKSYFSASGNSVVMAERQLGTIFDVTKQYDIFLRLKDYYNTNYVNSDAMILPISAPLLSKRYQMLGINKIPTKGALDVAGSGYISENAEVNGYIKAGAPIYSNTKQLQSYFLLNLSSLSTSNFYPVTFTKDDGILDCEIHSPNLGGGEAYNQNVIHFHLMSNGYNDTPHDLAILQYNLYDNSEVTIGCIGTGGSAGGLRCVWLRGGMNYRVYSNYTPTLHTSSYTTGNETYSVGTNYYGGTNTNVTVRFTPQSTIKSGAYFSNLYSPGIINLIYPVGSIYMSVDSNKDPNTMFIGTTWQRLKDRFLLGAGDSFSNGGTGGYKDLQAHTHSIPELTGSTTSTGTHKHVVTKKTTSYGSGSQSGWRCLSFADTSADWSQTVSTPDSDGGHSHDIKTTASTSGSTGNGAAAGAANANLPPYLVVMMWKRTA